MKDSNSKIRVLLEDDNEILGNGLGHTMYRQYLPTIRYVNILNKHNIRSTFYIDIAHLLFLKKHKEFRDFETQANNIIDLIAYLSKKEMDIQLHIHSQWVHAEIRNNEVYVSDKWNIGQLTKSEQIKLAEECINELRQIKSSLNDKTLLNSFKAGSWGLQPFDVLYDVFKENGIKVVMGPIKGLKIASLDMDYSGLESETAPFFCDQEDINLIGKKNDIVVLPMTPTYLNWPDFLRYLYQIKIKSRNEREDNIDLFDAPNEITSLKPLAGKDKLSLSSKPFQTHLKMNAQPYWYLKNTFKRAYKKIKDNDFPYKLMVLETHTKDFHNSFNDIDLFFEHIKREYDDVEFVTISDVVKDLEMGKLIPLIKK